MKRKLKQIELSERLVGGLLVEGVKCDLRVILDEEGDLALKIEVDEDIHPAAEFQVRHLLYELATQSVERYHYLKDEVSLRDVLDAIERAIKDKFTRAIYEAN